MPIRFTLIKLVCVSVFVLFQVHYIFNFLFWYTYIHILYMKNLFSSVWSCFYYVYMHQLNTPDATNMLELISQFNVYLYFILCTPFLKLLDYFLINIKNKIKTSKWEIVICPCSRSSRCKNVPSTMTIQDIKWYYYSSS